MVGTDGPDGPIADAPNVPGAAQSVVKESLITAPAAIAFLEEAARAFEKRDTGGEDMAHWANVYNAATCRRIVELLRISQ